MNIDEEMMKKAIEVAKASGDKYGHRIGAILVKDSKFMAEAPSVDSNFHAEANVIRLFLRDQKINQLTGYTLYSTQEPCTMCLGATLYANIDRIVFGAYAEDLSETNIYEYPDYSVEDKAKDSRKFDGDKLEITGGVLRKECADLLADHEYWTVKS